MVPLETPQVPPKYMKYAIFLTGSLAYNDVFESTESSSISHQMRAMGTIFIT